MSIFASRNGKSLRPACLRVRACLSVRFSVLFSSPPCHPPFFHLQLPSPNFLYERRNTKTKSKCRYFYSSYMCYCKRFAAMCACVCFCVCEGDFVSAIVCVCSLHQAPHLKDIPNPFYWLQGRKERRKNSNNNNYTAGVLKLCVCLCLVLVLGNLCRFFFMFLFPSHFHSILILRGCCCCCCCRWFSSACCFRFISVSPLFPSNSDSWPAFCCCCPQISWQMLIIYATLPLCILLYNCPFFTHLV